MSTIAESVEQTAINTIRTLAMDAVEAANCGHPGTPMALVPVAYQLWTQHLQYDPAASALAEPRSLRPLLRSRLDAALLADPPGRHPRGDARRQSARTSLSLPLDDIRNFRQWGSRTPGHPRSSTRPASKPPPARSARVAATASAWPSPARWLAARYNRPGFELFNFNVWTPVQRRRLDGRRRLRSRLDRRPPEALEPLLDLRRQSTSRSKARPTSRSAKTLPRDSAAWDGMCSPFTTPTTWRPSTKRTAASSSHEGSPTLIVVKSIIGYGAPTKANTAKAHGEPLGADEIAKAKAVLRLARPMPSSSCRQKCPSTSRNARQARRNSTGIG